MATKCKRHRWKKHPDYALKTCTECGGTVRTPVVNPIEVGTQVWCWDPVYEKVFQGKVLTFSSVLGDYSVRYGRQSKYVPCRYIFDTQDRANNFAINTFKAKIRKLGSEFQKAKDRLTSILVQYYEDDEG